MSAEAAKAATITRSFDSSDETRNISKGKVEVVNLGDVQAIWIDRGKLLAISDARHGGAAGGF